MARYSNTGGGERHETTREDRTEYATKWVSNYLSVKAIMEEHKFTKESEIVKHLVDEWETKANNKEDRDL